jgi:hypothetical protein
MDGTSSKHGGDEEQTKEFSPHTAETVEDGVYKSFLEYKETQPLKHEYLVRKFYIESTSL